MEFEQDALESLYKPRDTTKKTQNDKKAKPVLLNKLLSSAERDRPILLTPSVIRPQRETIQAEELSTKNAVDFLISGTLPYRVCKYCLCVTDELYELKRVIEIASKGGLYSVSIKDMIASFYPFQVTDDQNLPNRICNICLDRTIKAYLFTQQCEQAERAMLNCYEDISTKLSKLDPLEPKKHARGRKKTNFNHNRIHAEHLNVIDYADPIIHIINTCSESLSTEPAINPTECPKCFQVLPTVEALANHSKIHPKSMWYNCRLCGKSFPKLTHLRSHYLDHKRRDRAKSLETEERKFKCQQCSETHDKYYLHLQHIEKHKFKMVLEYLVDSKMDELCSICLDIGDLVPLDTPVCIQGGPPNLMGEMTMQSILASTLPEIGCPNSYTGSKICEKCVDTAITAYNFMYHTYFVRDRLNTCITLMLDSLKDIRPEKNLCIEISKETIMPITGSVDEAFFDEINENEIEFLEDEYRMESEDESNSETEIEEEINVKINNKELDSLKDIHSENNLCKDISKETIMPIRESVDEAFFDEINEYEIEFLEDEYRVKSEVEFDLETEIKKEINVEINNKVNNELEVKGTYLNGYQTDVCSEFLTFKKRKLQKSIKKFTCPICSKHFLSDYFVKKHILKHISKKVECKPCGTVFGNQFSLNEHTKYAHVLYQSDYKACKICGRGFAKLDKLNNHEKEHKNKICLLCDKVFRTQPHYDAHMRRHIPKLMALKKKYGQSCSFCEKVCPNDNQLLLHVNKVHLQIKPYNCDMCEKQFYTEYNLRFHRKIHNRLKKEKCNFCGVTLKSRKQLVIHIRKHIGVTPYTCQMCSQSYHLLSKLKSHMDSTHGGAYICKICKHISRSKTGLKAHKRWHSFLKN